MNKIKLTLLALYITAQLNAQNLYPKKLDNCLTTDFCLDCGDIKANIDKEKFDKLLTALNSNNNLKGISGKIMVQVILDSNGKGCVLSHTDVSDNIISKNIVIALNEFDGFIPAKTKGKIEARTSFNLSFEIKDGSITAKVERVDMDAFNKSFDKPNSPEIYNKDYVYKNENLKNYKITVWNSQNAGLPNNRNDHITIDKKGIIWLTADHMLVKFDGKNFIRVEPAIAGLRMPFDVYAIASDNKNRKWIYGQQKILSYDDKTWTLYDQSKFDIFDVWEMIFNKNSNELFFCSQKGLTIRKNENWEYLNKDKKYPFADVDFAKRDSKNQLWIGTFKGSFLIDVNGKCTSFNETESVLNGQCITDMDEDENGNLYFTLYEYGRKSAGKVNRNEGIAIKYANGDWKQLTTSNSGMPFNHANCVLYDRKEKILWISTDRAGLVRYDLKDGWENYHSDNSEIPTSYISTMSFDNNGVLYLATRQGLVKVERK